MGDCEQMVRRMKPVAKKLESLSEEIEDNCPAVGQMTEMA